MHQRDETGDTLVEILIAVVIIGIVMGSFFGAITTGARASKTHRDLVTADAALRGYAESAKQAARDTCMSGNAGAPFTPPYTAPPNSGITVAAPATDLICPSVNSVSTINITAQLPNGISKDLSIDVGTQ
jgi:type II secretory pathway pseudopilin PulG